ncbi:Fic family protein [Candidatus Babeliales bacterium]|nr:Fic family protein [Candidatus Babeliales bacterium]
MYSNKIGVANDLQKEIAGYPPLNDFQRNQLKEYFRISLTYTSNALEGNSLTETETKIILEDGITIGGKTLREHYEAVGHAQAYDHLLTLVNQHGFSEENITTLHKLFFEKIDSSQAGVYRFVPVLVTGSDFEFPAPQKIASLVHNLVNQQETLKLKHPIEYAAIVHNQLVTIHPFVDGNGRTARLLANLLLVQAGYPITIIPPVVRADYLTSVKAGNRDNQEPMINFLSCMVWESAKDYLRMLRTLNQK